MKNLTYITALLVLVLTSCKKDQTTTRDRWYFQNDGANMMVNVEGNLNSKTFILLLHGGPGGDGAGYNSGSYTQILEEQYAIAYWDQRGQGASQGKYAQSDVTVSKMAEDCAKLAKAMKLKYGDDISLFLLGHSWGGMLGTAALCETDIQSDIKGWIDVDGAHNIPLLNKSAIQMMKDIAPEMIRTQGESYFWTEMIEFANSVDTSNISVSEGGQINSMGHQAESNIEALTSDPDQSYDPFFTYVFTNPTSPYNSEVTGGQTSSMLFQEVETTSYGNQLDKITVPCLFQWGKYDFVVPPAVGLEAYNGVSTPNADKFYKEYATSGHSPMSNQPQLFCNDIITFIEAYK